MLLLGEGRSAKAAYEKSPRDWPRSLSDEPAASRDAHTGSDGTVPEARCVQKGILSSGRHGARSSARPPCVGRLRPFHPATNKENSSSDGGVCVLCPCLERARE